MLASAAAAVLEQSGSKDHRGHGCVDVWVDCWVGTLAAVLTSCTVSAGLAHLPHSPYGCTSRVPGFALGGNLYYFGHSDKGSGHGTSTDGEQRHMPPIEFAAQGTGMGLTCGHLLVLTRKDCLCW